MKVYTIYFSPTGGTKRVADILSHAISDEIVPVDLTDPGSQACDIAPTQEDLAVIAVPSYGGRVPAVDIQRMAAVKGNGTRAVLVCVYGNRAYEDTLIELQDAAKRAGFTVIAGIAAIAEHSIVRQFAQGRPDAQDDTQLLAFAGRIAEKIAAKDVTQPQIPGHRPYKKTGGGGMIPKPTERCVQCGVCAKQCPVQAIHPQHPEQVKDSACISCMRCVQVCPHGARQLDAQRLAAVCLALEKVCSDRKVCELFL